MVPNCINYIPEVAEVFFDFGTLLRLLFFSALIWLPISYAASKFNLIEEENNLGIKGYISALSATFGVFMAHAIENSYYIPCDPGQAPSLEFIKVFLNNLFNSAFIAFFSAIAAGFITVFIIMAIPDKIMENNGLSDTFEEYILLASVFILSCFLGFLFLYSN